MPETLAEQLVKLAGVLHWFGRFREANLLNSLARFLRAAKLDTVEKLEELTTKQEELTEKNHTLMDQGEKGEKKPLTVEAIVTLGLIACESTFRIDPNQLAQMAFEVLSDAERCNQHIMIMLRTGVTDAETELREVITQCVKPKMMVGDLTANSWCTIFAAPNNLLEAAKLFHPDHDFVIEEL